MVTLKNRVVAVTLFPDRARVTRSGTVEVVPGPLAVEIPDLPLNLETESLRARASGSAQASLLGVELHRVHFAETPTQQARGLEKRLEDLGLEEQSLIDQGDILQKLLAHLDGLLDATRTYAYALSNRKSDLEAHAALLAYYRQASARVQEDLREVGSQRRQIAREMDKARRELGGLTAARPTQRHVAEIDFDVQSPGELTIALSYHLPGCSWTPLYDGQLHEKGLRLRYLGQVQQATGEDWAEVELALSTAYPHLATVLPELAPWYLSEHRPAPTPLLQHMPVPEPGQRPVPVSPSAVDAAAEDIPATTAEIAQHGAAVTYRVPGLVTMSGDGSSRKLAIADLDLIPSLDYLAAPRLAQAVYRRVKVANESPYLLLPGRAQLFDRDEYIGTARLDLTAPGQEIELYFGVDDRMRVKGEMTRRDVDKRLIGDRRRVRYTYEIEVENHTGEHQTITVRDQIPVPRHEEIKVRLEDSQPRPENQDDLNRLEWLLDLQPGGKQVVRISFSVEFPRDMRVAGLP